MPLLDDEYRKDEKIDGIIYDMSPAPSFKHSIINGNIYNIIKTGLKNSLCLAFMENLDYKYHPDKNDDYVVPDIIIVCDRKRLKGGSYSGTPKFIVETLSPSTAMKDRTTKMVIYEQSCVSEYWIVSPKGKSVEIYYLENGKYNLVNSYILEEDTEDKDYNAKTVIKLREFPNIVMTLDEIFEDID